MVWVNVSSACMVDVLAAYEHLSLALQGLGCDAGKRATLDCHDNGKPSG
jgi:hypothetical protein